MCPQPQYSLQRMWLQSLGWFYRKWRTQLRKYSCLRNWTWLLPLLLFYFLKVSLDQIFPSACSHNPGFSSAPHHFLPELLLSPGFLFFSIPFSTVLQVEHPTRQTFPYHLPLFRVLSASYLPRDKGWMGLTTSFRVDLCILPISPSLSLPPTLHFLLYLDI